MLRIDALLPAPQRGGGAAAFHFGDIGGHRALRLIWKMPSAFAWAIMQMRICKIANYEFAKYEAPSSVCPELVEGPLFLIRRQGRCFDRLSTSGMRKGACDATTHLCRTEEYTYELQSLMRN